MLADAAVSVLAVIGLVTGGQLGWIWMDPVMGIVGVCVIANWSWALLRAARAIPVDVRPDTLLVGARQFSDGRGQKMRIN